MGLRGGALLVALAMAAIGCGGGEPDREVVRVFAAASLTDVFSDLESAFESANPTIDVELNFAGSSTLREQIRSGAPADVFASANEPIMSDLSDDGLIAGEAVIFVRNELQIAVPRGNPASVRGIGDFARSDLFLGACAEGVPCGDAALTVAEKANVVLDVDTNEPNVRALVAKVAAGELDAGLVWTTDVISNLDIDGVVLDPAVNITTRYPIARLVDAGNSDDAERFIAFVLGESGQRALIDRGFEPVR